MAARTDGALARNLDVDEVGLIRQSQTALRLVPAWRSLRGPDKYKVLAHRLHQAQIKARRVLELAAEVQ
ncbi:MAG: hypothetical protein ABIX28_13525 [Vicinamibacterales bacterium]